MSTDGTTAGTTTSAANAKGGRAMKKSSVVAMKTMC